MHTMCLQLDNGLLGVVYILVHACSTTTQMYVQSVHTSKLCQKCAVHFSLDMNEVYCPKCFGSEAHCIKGSTQHTVHVGPATQSCPTSSHITLIDSQLNSTMHLISECVQPLQIPRLLAQTISLFHL